MEILKSKAVISSKVKKDKCGKFNLTPEIFSKAFYCKGCLMVAIFGVAYTNFPPELKEILLMIIFWVAELFKAKRSYLNLPVES